MAGFEVGCVLLAQEQGGAGGPLSMLPAFALMAVAFYLLMVRPQRREKAQRDKMIAELKKNDRIVTIGGIYGKVANVRADADEVTVLVDENSNTKLRMTRSAIHRVIGDEPAAEEAPK